MIYNLDKNALLSTNHKFTRKFEHKICSLEDSKDFSEMSLQELVNALQAVEQRQVYRQEGTSEGALVAVFKEKS
jgi:hypothetical protein